MNKFYNIMPDGLKLVQILHSDSVWSLDEVVCINKQNKFSWISKT